VIHGEATVLNRLAVYHRQTRPLIDYYRGWAASGDARAPKYHRIDGIGTVDEVRERIFAALG
jgi:adenylate kinase